MGPKIDETLMPDVEGFISFQDFQEISRRYDVESFHVKRELLYNSDKSLSTRCFMTKTWTINLVSILY